MGSIAKPFNRVFFLLCVLITGSLAGAFVWLFFFLMDVGISFLWQTLPGWIGSVTAEPLPVLSQGPFGFVPFPLIVCVLGGLVIGLYAKHTGVEPEDLNSVMAKVKQDGRYDYSHIGKLSLAALLPLLFGGSIGPEAGLTGVIAGLCTWVGDRMRKFGADFRALTVAGTQAALAALFTAPLYGFVAPLSGTADGTRGEENIALPKAQKAVVYLCAIVGALSAFLILGQLFGENSGLPRFDAVEVGSYTMFAGESQAHRLMEGYSALPAAVLITTGFVKCALTPTCLNLGWRGGHFFPVIFSGVSLGYGFALLTGAAPAFCVAACTSALMGAVMRQPIMAALLLMLCFPLKGVVVMLVAAVIGAAIPLPRVFRPNTQTDRA